MQSIFYFLLALFSLIFLWIKRRYSHWKSRGFIQGDATFPFGSYKGIGTSITSFEGLNKYYKNFKGKAKIVGLYSFFTPELLVIDPELIREVLVKEFSSFSNRGMYYNKKDDPTSANILTLEAAEWRERRTKLSPIFSSGKMKMMFDIVESVAERLVKAIDGEVKGKEELEMRNWSQRFTADSIGNTAFGIECKCIEDENSEFLRYGRRLFNLSPFEIIKFFFATDNPKLARKLGIRFNPKEAGDFFLQTMLATFKYREENKVQRNDFVSLLLGLKENFTREELASEGFLVFAGGYETSSTLMSFTLYELALDQEIQEKLRDELTKGVEENEGKISYDLLFGFKYLDMIFTESLRKYPPIPDTLRQCTKTFKIPGSDLIIEEGTNIEVPVYSLHHDEEFWEDPEKFDPERFNEENSKKIKPFTYLPFGDGPRNCLGLRFGLMQSKLAIAKLILNFKFSPTSNTDIPLKYLPSNPFMTPTNGIRLKVERI